MRDFKAGDLVACGPEAMPQFGIVLRVNGKPPDDICEIVVCWGDIDEVKGFTSDEYPDAVRFVTHIPGAECLDERQELNMQEWYKCDREKHQELMGLLDRLEKALTNQNNNQ